MLRTLRVYVAGAWTEQHERARPMIARLRKEGIVITQDWTVFESERVGVGDSDLSAHERFSYATADLDGIQRADLVWLLAENDKGACGSWVELGAAIMLRRVRDRLRAAIPQLYVDNGPIVVVSGAKRARSIFTELCDKTFDSDSDALLWIIVESKGTNR